MRELIKDIKGGARVIRGQVSSAGGVVYGTGFTVTKISTGLYQINFLEPMKGQPLGYASSNNANAARFGVNVIGATKTSIQFQWYSSAAALIDTDFVFLVMET